MCKAQKPFWYCLKFCLLLELNMFGKKRSKFGKVKAKFGRKKPKFGWKCEGFRVKKKKEVRKFWPLSRQSISGRVNVVTFFSLLVLPQSFGTQNVAMFSKSKIVQVRRQKGSHLFWKFFFQKVMIFSLSSNFWRRFFLFYLQFMVLTRIVTSTRQVLIMA